MMIPITFINLLRSNSRLFKHIRAIVHRRV
ncbi:hypothetical protein MNBD_ALPHA04-2223, partial [hydrothermal vent metagenome]